MGFSITHVIILLVIVLLIFGPKNLPKLGQSLGEAIRGFKKGINDDEIDVTNSRRDQIKDAHESSRSKQTEEEKDKV